MRRRKTIAVTTAAVLAAVGGLTAAALPAGAAVAVNAAVWVEGSSLRYRAGGDAANNLLVGPHGVGWILRELNASTLTLDRTRPGPCLQLTTREIYCDTRALRLSAELGAGNDILDNARGANLATLVQGGDGHDLVLGGAGVDEMYGGQGRDTLFGGPGDDRLYGGNDDDQLRGQDGPDVLDGQNGNDELLGGTGNDTLLNPAKTRDAMHGEPGNDVIYSGDHNYGGDGDDVIYVQKGFGDFWGGVGFDTIDYAPWPYQRLVVSLDGNDNDGSGECPNCPADDKPGRHNVHGDFERVLGSPGVDSITGNNEADLIEGRGGDDYLAGSGGDDVLDAGPGAAQGADGGSGTDTCLGENLTRIRRCDNF